MSKKVLVVIIGSTLLLGAAFVMAQEGRRGPAGRRGPQSGRSQFGPMGEWLDNLTRAYEQKDMDKIGQLIEQMKQGRQGFAGRMGRGGPGGPPRGFGGFGPGGSQAGSHSFLDGTPIPKTDSEKKILSVLDEMAQDRSRTFANVSPTDGRLLRQLTEAVGAKRVIEIGTSTGYSGLWFAMALRTTGGKLITHEIDSGRAAMARDNFKKAGVDDLITIVQGNAHETVKQQKDPIDILFLDADKEGYVDYLNKLLPLIRPGGLIIAHNMNTRQADPRYVEAITTNSELETLLLLREGTGVSVTLKKR
ncbi:MAG: class I SAM-dependent methyltransferase [Phycisphaerales bacterium]|nr:MAG: class I SAM-dependent methyltransferase [Phycisphaerales bacterium]